MATDQTTCSHQEYIISGKEWFKFTWMKISQINLSEGKNATSSLFEVTNTSKILKKISRSKRFINSSIQRRHLCQLARPPFGISQADWSQMRPCPYAANMATNSKTTATQNKETWTETSFQKDHWFQLLFPQWLHAKVTCDIRSICIIRSNSSTVTGSAVNFKKEVA